jgi:hypothetical protein
MNPKLVTAPYLESSRAFMPVMHQLNGADDARRMVKRRGGERSLLLSVRRIAVKQDDHSKRILRRFVKK